MGRLNEWSQARSSSKYKNRAERFKWRDKKAKEETKKAQEREWREGRFPRAEGA